MSRSPIKRHDRDEHTETIQDRIRQEDARRDLAETFADIDAIRQGAVKRLADWSKS